jgi:DNA-binding MarR family transcriptional regulator
MDQVQLARHEDAIAAMLRDSMKDVDTSGVELLRLVKMTGNLYDIINGERLREADLSGPRLWLLTRLWMEETHGHVQGTRPTHLSRWQNVSKNTISALLRGLEEQGLVERALDSEDRRVFRIRLTAAGRELVQRIAPRHLASLNQLAGGLATAERAELIVLLQKLYCSLAAQASLPEAACPGETGGSRQNEVNEGD